MLSKGTVWIIIVLLPVGLCTIIIYSMCPKSFSIPLCSICYNALQFALHWRIRASARYMEERREHLLIGAQGSGKGTQAEKLSAALHLTHISSGDSQKSYE